MVSSELPFLEFSESNESQKIKAQSKEIAWVESLTDLPGASYDLVIKDALGREKFRKVGCTSETEKYGERINVPTFLGEDIEVVIENLKGAKSVKLFLN